MIARFDCNCNKRLLLISLLISILVDSSWTKTNITNNIVQFTLLRLLYCVPVTFMKTYGSAANANEVRLRLNTRISCCENGAHWIGLMSNHVLHVDALSESLVTSSILFNGDKEAYALSCIIVKTVPKLQFRSPSENDVRRQRLARSHLGMPAAHQHANWPSQALSGYCSPDLPTIENYIHIRW